MSTPSDRASLEREIRARQQHLATTVDELAARVTPKALAQTAATTASTKVKGLLATATGKAQGTARKFQSKAPSGTHQAIDPAQDPRSHAIGPAPALERAPERDQDHPQGQGRGQAAIGAVRMAVGPAVVDEDGALRVARITAAGSAALALAGAVIWRRSVR